VKTADIGGQATTAQMGDAICQEIINRTLTAGGV